MPIAQGVRIVNRSRGTTIAHRVEIATSLWARGRGLIGRRSLPDGFGLVIKPCGSIHMLMMSLPLDILHIDKQNRVVKVVHAIKPWQFGPIVLKSRWVVELPAGTAKAAGCR